MGNIGSHEDLTLGVGGDIKQKKQMARAAFRGKKLMVGRIQIKCREAG